MNSPPRLLRRTHCIACHEPFSEANVYSGPGWLETQLSGLCELCFDILADIPAIGDDDEKPLEKGRDGD